MHFKAPQSQARRFGRAGESVTRSDRRERELEFQSPFPPLTARPNRRRDDNLGLADESSPLRGAPIDHLNRGKTLTPVGHPSISPSERRFAPTTVRQARNGVRYGSEQVSAFIGIRSMAIEAKFDFTAPFSEGKAAIKIKNAFGYITTNGAIVIKPQFKDATAFYNGLAVVSTRQGYGYIGQTGEFVIQPKFTAAYPFKGKLAQVALGSFLSPKWAYIDGRGKVVWPP